METCHKPANAKSVAALTALGILYVCIPLSAAPWQGSGTADEPYLIADANDMQAVGADPNYWDAHFKLTADIDLSRFTGTDFNIIGCYYRDGDPNNAPYIGVFNGNGHTVKSFTYDSNDANGVGLFGFLESQAQVRDLTLEAVDVNVLNGDKVGALVGFNRGRISYCHANGSVAGGSYLGGLVGDHQDGTILGCSVACSVSGDDNVGGLLGFNEHGSISQCYAEGFVQGLNNVGGIVGRNSTGAIATPMLRLTLQESEGSADSSGRITVVFLPPPTPQAPSEEMSVGDWSEIIPTPQSQNASPPVQ